MVRVHSGGTQFIASAILAAMVAQPLCAAYTDGEFIAEGALDAFQSEDIAIGEAFTLATGADLTTIDKNDFNKNTGTLA